MSQGTRSAESVQAVVVTQCQLRPAPRPATPSEASSRRNGASEALVSEGGARAWECVPQAKRPGYNYRAGVDLRRILDSLRESVEAA